MDGAQVLFNSRRILRRVGVFHRIGVLVVVALGSSQRQSRADPVERVISSRLISVANIVVGVVIVLRKVLGVVPSDAQVP